jgi:hypothetical protein
MPVFFNSIVSKEEDKKKGLYLASSSNSTIVQDQLRFGTKKVCIYSILQTNGRLYLLGYQWFQMMNLLKLLYHLGWKTKEREGWNHREGSMQWHK